MVNCRHTNRPSAMNPILKEIRTSVLPHPLLPETLNPYNTPPNPRDDRVMDKAIMLF